MHPLLEHLSVFTWTDILESNEKCIAFLEDLKLIPRKTDPAPSCPRCSGPMDVEETWWKKSVLGWKWKCKKRYVGYNIKNPRFESEYLVDSQCRQFCYAGVNPLDGTFFEDTHLPLNDVIALIFGYVLPISLTSIKEHLNCWRRHRNQSQISDSIVRDIYSRLDDIIFFALSQEGNILNKHEEINRITLLEEYAKALKVEPVFRNIVFQLLMAIKYQYPCIKNEICESDIVCSTNENSFVKNTFSHEIVLNSSISPVSPALNSYICSADSKIGKCVTANSVPTTCVETTILKDFNSTAGCIDNTNVKSVNTNSVPFTASAQAVYSEVSKYPVVNVKSVTANSVSITTNNQIANSRDLNNSDISVDNKVIRNVTAGNAPITTNDQIANSNALNYFSVSVDNTMVRNVTADSITKNGQTVNSKAVNSSVTIDETNVTVNIVPISNSLQTTNYQSISDEKVNLNKIENNIKIEDMSNNIKIEDISNLNTSSSTNTSFSNNVPLKDFIPNYPSDFIIFDSIVYDDMDIGSVVDVSAGSQTAINADYKNLNLPNCPNVNEVSYNQNENNIEIENINDMNSSLNDSTFEAASDDNSSCSSTSNHVSVNDSLSDDSMSDSSDHVINDESLSDNDTCNSPSDHVLIDNSVTSDNYLCTSSDCVIIDGIVFQDDLAMNIDHVEIISTINNE